MNKYYTIIIRSTIWIMQITEGRSIINHSSTTTSTSSTCASSPTTTTSSTCASSTTTSSTCASSTNTGPPSPCAPSTTATTTSDTCASSTTTTVTSSTSFTIGAASTTCFSFFGFLFLACPLIVSPFTAHPTVDDVRSLHEMTATKLFHASVSSQVIHITPEPLSSPSTLRLHLQKRVWPNMRAMVLRPL